MDPRQFTERASGRLVRTTGGYLAFVPKPLPPALRWSSPLIGLLSKADHALGELAGIGRTLPNPHLLIVPFIRREAVLSSRIEGTRASLSDLYAYEAVQIPLFNTPPDVREIFNYVRALEYGLSRLEDLPVSLRLIRELHALLLEGVRGQHRKPGEFRNEQNWIGPSGCTLEEATFVPTPVEELHPALGELERFLHRPSDIPALVRLGMIHYQFEAIHPFTDGNGRIGRLLISLLLCAWDLLPQPLLYLSAYFEAHRQEYYDLLLTVSQRGGWEEWIGFFLKGIASQAMDAILRSYRLQDLRREYRERFQNRRTAARLLQAVEHLFEFPVFTVKQMAAALGVEFGVANRYVRQLEAEVVIREITGRKRNRMYQADEIIRTIERPLDKEP
ncbi:Fic family protein [Candidatus Acetothermia bacterium]|nr:MAG: Fic family protein [Candidatus Acetothermia bacterium]